MAESNGQRLYGCEYQGKLYFTAGPAEQTAFQENPEKFLQGLRFPSAAQLPQRLVPGDVDSTGAKLGLKGFCPVSLLEVIAFETLGVIFVDHRSCHV